MLDFKNIKKQLFNFQKYILFIDILDLYTYLQQINLIQKVTQKLPKYFLCRKQHSMNEKLLFLNN